MDAILTFLHDTKKNTTEADKLLYKYPERVPVIVSRNKNSKNTPELDKYKYLVPSDLTIGQFLYVIRKRLNLSPATAMFLFIDNNVVCNTSIISQIYAECRDKNDGFLHAVYSCENTFG